MKTLTIALLTVAALAHAAPIACPTTGTLQDFLDFGAEGCYVGRVTLSDFSFLPQTATSNPSSTEIIVRTAAGLLDDPDTVIIEDSDGFFSVGQNQSINFFVDFNVTARAPDSYLYAVSLTADAAVTSNGNNAKIQERIYNYPALNQIAQMQITQGNSGAVLTRDFPFETTIRVSKEFDLFAQNNIEASASLGPVTQDFYATPEPGSLAMLLTGGIALVLLGKRTSPRKGLASQQTDGGV